MSIPPLVCSTPPPPDQCEDDKDPEDFDIQYNLSQDDDDDNYNYGSFSTFNHFEQSQSKTDPVIAKVVESKNDDSMKKVAVENVDTNSTTESKLELEEETNIEDLNLDDLKMDQDTIECIDIIESNVETKRSDHVDSGQETQILENLTNISRPDDIHEIQNDELDIEPCSIDQAEEPPSYVDEIIAAVNDLQFTPTEPELPFDVSESEEKSSKITEVEKHNISIKSEIVTEHKQEVNVDDDFGDFDNFQFASSSDKPVTLVGCDNPWDKNDDAADNDFGEFKANFEDNAESNTFNAFTEKSECSTVTPEEQVNESSLLSASVPDPNMPTDDDFGDFNDFQSSTTDLQVNTEDEDLPPLLNLQLPDEKLMESITSVVHEIFDKEIPEPEENSVVSLDSVLGVTWGHLLQTDERQPYMVNWNDCLGQKTLLKALCIDSRNILFGPKWNYSMPKYAATLSAAPLQPQKPISAPSATVETTNPEKSGSKAPGTWSDPFTSDGIESCNPDAPSENPVIETGPTDLDVFEASTSSKSDKIFSSVQPLRQISLPDTHIFTPTDSETPRSTTIHYDNSPTVLLPQTVIESSISEPNFKSEPQTLPSKPSADDNDDYWEFQDFKGPSNTAPTPSDTSKPNPNIAYATQVLQPIKLEPTVPTLNWPDPGEVKETFDDFSDFVSNSSLSNPQQQTPTVPVQKIDTKAFSEFDIAGPSKTVVTPTERLANDSSGDDDFDTFQSALPSTSSVDINFSNLNKDSNAAVGKPIISPTVSTKTMTDFDFAFPKVETVKNNTISIENVNKPQDSLVKNQIPLFPSNLEVKSQPVQAMSTPVMNIGLLQPTPAITTATLPNQQKSAQILQPLSLESFSQINWPNPGIDLQDLSRFNPVETLNSLKSDLSVNSQTKVASPVHSLKNQKGVTSNQSLDDDWGDFVSSVPKPQQQTMPKKQTTFADDDEWTDFVSSPSVKPQNGLNTISLNVHTNFQSKPSKYSKGKKVPLEIPALNYITPKSSSHKSYNDRHFQNL